MTNCGTILGWNCWGWVMTDLLFIIGIVCAFVALAFMMKALFRKHPLRRIYSGHTAGCQCTLCVHDIITYQN